LFSSLQVTFHCRLQAKVLIFGLTTMKDHQTPAVHVTTKKNGGGFTVEKTLENGGLTWFHQHNQQQWEVDPLWRS
jgi:hypothetical protein